MKLISIVLLVTAVLLIFTDVFAVRRGMLRIWVVLSGLWVVIASGVLAFDSHARYEDPLSNFALVVAPPFVLVLMAGVLWALMRAAWWALRGFRPER